MTSFAGCDLPYLATTMEYAGGPESTTFIGFIVLLTLPVSAGIARQMGQGGILRTRSGQAERSINLVKADDTLNPGDPRSPASKRNERKRL